MMGNEVNIVSMLVPLVVVNWVLSKADVSPKFEKDSNKRLRRLLLSEWKSILKSPAAISLAGCARSTAGVNASTICWGVVPGEAYTEHKVVSPRVIAAMLTLLAAPKEVIFV